MCRVGLERECLVLKAIMDGTTSQYEKDKLKERWRPSGEQTSAASYFSRQKMIEEMFPQISFALVLPHATRCKALQSCLVA